MQRFTLTISADVESWGFNAYYVPFEKQFRIAKLTNDVVDYYMSSLIPLHFLTQDLSEEDTTYLHLIGAVECTDLIHSLIHETYDLFLESYIQAQNDGQ